MGLFVSAKRVTESFAAGMGKSNSELTVMDGWLRTSGTLFREMEIFGITCRFLTLEGLIKAKRAVGRTGERLESASGIGSPLGIRKREVS
jgi:hypothetical protein